MYCLSIFRAETWRYHPFTKTKVDNWGISEFCKTAVYMALILGYISYGIRQYNACNLLYQYI